VKPHLAFALILACAHAPLTPPNPVPTGPALVLDGAVLSCRVQNVAVPDTGCAALAFVSLKELSFLSGAEAVHYFGPPARFGAYVAHTPALDLTPLPTTATAALVAIVVNGNRSTCLVPAQRDARVIGGSRVGPSFPCPALDELSPNRIETIELLKPPQSIAYFGRDAAAYALIVTLK